MPTEVNRPAAPTIGTAATPSTILPATNSRDATPLGLTPLAIIAILALVLHVASGIVFDRSHASPAGAALDDAVTCAAQTSPLQPSLPYD